MKNGVAKTRLMARFTSVFHRASQGLRSTQPEAPFLLVLGWFPRRERANEETRNEKRNRQEGEADGGGGPRGLCCTGGDMKVHLFHLGVTGLLRAWNQCRAGWRLCRAAKKPFRKLLPESINSMTAAWNVWRIFKNDELPVPGTIWDVGANLNQMTRMILMLNEGADVVSFEPNPALKPMGKRMMMGVSDMDGTAVFSMPGNDSGWGTIESVETVEKGGKQGQTRMLSSSAPLPQGTARCRPPRKFRAGFCPTSGGASSSRAHSNPSAPEGRTAIWKNDAMNKENQSTNPRKWHE